MGRSLLLPIFTPVDTELLMEKKSSHSYLLCDHDALSANFLQAFIQQQEATFIHIYKLSWISNYWHILLLSFRLLCYWSGVVYT